MPPTRPMLRPWAAGRDFPGCRNTPHLTRWQTEDKSRFRSMQVVYTARSAACRYERDGHSLGIA